MLLTTKRCAYSSITPVNLFSCFLVVAILFISCGVSAVQAEKKTFLETFFSLEDYPIAESGTNKFLDSKIEFPIRKTLLNLMGKVAEKSSISFNELAILDDEIISFNAAELYLLNYLRSQSAYQEGNIQKAINWGNKALSFQEQMTKEQLETPLFFELFLALSTYHSELEQYQQAYDKKEMYIKRYSASRVKEKNNRIALLNEKYETALKQKENVLLENQNELKQLRIKESENEKSAQLRNILILSFVAIIFSGLLIRQIKVSRKLKVLAKTDALTGLFNRRSLFEKGNILVDEAVKQGIGISAILLDIDYFKSVNDTFGHDVGDKVIKMVADVSSETMRSRDYFARLGGEEYAAILPGASLDEAKAFAERLREKVEQLDLSPFNVEHKITVSIGVANLNQVSPVFDDLLHAADEAMYHAKEQGRNRVCCYQINGPI
ncbi:MAG: GGDEF domain-containing protein [Thalassotalea sp.]|mgnify:FL=1